jgi:DNA-binding CsgD family transcriptional regulator
MPEELLEVLCAAFDELGIAVLILSMSGRVLLANLAAKGMLNKSWPLRVVDGHLQAADQTTDAEIRHAIESLGQQNTNTNEYAVCLVKYSEEQCGALGCFRLLRLSGEAQPAIGLFITETRQQSHYSIDGFAEAYKLSKAEARTLKAFVETQAPAEAAARLNVAVSTVKSHIRKIFHKTNTSRQADLLRLVESCRTPFPSSESSES